MLSRHLANADESRSNLQLNKYEAKRVVGGVVAVVAEVSGMQHQNRKKIRRGMVFVTDTVQRDAFHLKRAQR